ncbi:MAG: small ribosomal subunit Rsm22 family protein [Dongiaceae bacterium]
MQLPPALRQAVERELQGIPLSDLRRAADRLSRRYRSEARDGWFHLNDELAARAYLVTRMPATFAAISAGVHAVTGARPEFAPRSILDVGTGPGTATWAAAMRCSTLRDAVLIEGSPPIRVVGARLAQELMLDRTVWLSARLDDDLSDLTPRDLVVLAYVLDELAPKAREPLIELLWRLTSDTLLVVEPGTTEGWKRILQARDQLLAAGAHVLAPCPHAGACPLAPPDWCHFATRVARSRLHREVKGGTVPWEDEKFIYLAVSRHVPAQRLPRVLAPPHATKADVTLKLCNVDGSVAERTVGKRDSDAFKAARRLDWGDALPS